MTRSPFEGKGAVYAQNRPQYPEALFAFLLAEGVLGPEKEAADVGSGTGLFTRQLARYVKGVWAVEPDGDMARAADYGGFPNIRPVQGSAGATGLPGRSLDLAAAAQAFHWFDPEAFRAECRRILRPGGQALLVWNQRDTEDPLMEDLYALNRRYCPGFQGFTGGRDLTEGLPEFFGGPWREARFPNDTFCGEAGFLGRCLSSSYAPRPGTGAYDPYCRALEALFRRRSAGGRVRYPYTCRCYWGGLGD